jgi:hypothetical protein
MYSYGYDVHPDDSKSLEVSRSGREANQTLPTSAEVGHAHPTYIVRPAPLSTVGEASSEIRAVFIESNKVLITFIYLSASEVKSLHLSS